MSVFRAIRAVTRDARGQDLIEYLLLGALIAIAAYLGVTSLGVSLSGYFGGVAQHIESVGGAGSEGAAGSSTATSSGSSSAGGSGGTASAGIGNGNGNGGGSGNQRGGRGN